MHSGSNPKEVRQIAAALSQTLASFNDRLTPEQRDLAAISMTIRYSEAARIAARTPDTPVGTTMAFISINRALEEDLQKDFLGALPADLAKEIAAAARDHLQSHLIASAREQPARAV